MLYRRGQIYTNNKFKVEILLVDQLGTALYKHHMKYATWQHYSK